MVIIKNNDKQNEEELVEQWTENDNKKDSKQNIEISEIIYKKVVKKYNIPNKKCKVIKVLKDFEINSLDNEEAIRLDKRNFYDYYFSLLKYYHPFSFSFIPFND